MMTIRDWNEQGLIPGPNETEEEFIKRAHFCLELEKEFAQKLGAELPFEANDQASKNVLKESFVTTLQLYGISPSWIPLFFSNHHLAPWHGGCAWIFQLDERTPTAAFIQLRSQFHYSSSYLGLYSRRELVAHELSHVGRMMYEEPRFEEFLAYQTSASPWRRWFGPLMQSSKETLFFILLLGFFIMANIALFVIDDPASFQLFGWLQALLLSVVGIACIRLGWRHWQFYQCFKKLNTLSQSDQIAQHLIYRLTDKEICLFSSLSPEQIKTFIQEQSSFRWHFLRENYPSVA